jgi:DNA-binding NarL/FixJ family response regulator
MSPPPDMDNSRRAVEARRKRILWLTARNWSAPEIARELGICVRTVQRHRHNIRTARPIGKRGISTCAALARRAVIAELTTRNWPTAEIAQKLGISPRTVRRDRHAIDRGMESK